MTTIGINISRDRQNLGMSQHELAQRVGVTQQSISKWEKGRATPRHTKLKKLVEILGTDSYTARVLSDILSNPDILPTNIMGQRLPINQQPSQEEALNNLAHAALELAKAARIIAAQVEALTVQYKKEAVNDKESSHII